MNLSRHRILRAAALVLAAAVTTTTPPSFAQAPAKTYRGCAVVDADKILRISKSSKAAQDRLMAEFAAQEARLTSLRSARHDAERTWRDARSQRPEAEVAALRQTLDASIEALLREQKDFDRLLDKRKNEELRKLVERANRVYRKIGEREQYAKLYQTGEDEPVFDPEPDARSYQCTAKVDVTDTLIRDLDAEL